MLNSLQNKRTLQPHDEQRKKIIFKVIPVQRDITYLVFDFLVLLKSLTIPRSSKDHLSRSGQSSEINYDLQN